MKRWDWAVTLSTGSDQTSSYGTSRARGTGSDVEIIPHPNQRRCAPDLGRIRGFRIGAGRGHDEEWRGGSR